MVAVKDEKGRSKDARQFANGLRKILKKEPFNIGGTAKPFGGPGKAVLILGNK